MAALTVAAVSLLSLAAVPSAFAAAGTVILESGDPIAGGGSVSFNAGTATPNRLTVASAPGTVTFTDTADVIAVGAASGPGCTGTGTKTVTCTGPGLTFVNAFLEDLDDTATHTGSLSFFVNGGTGDDGLTGGSGDDLLTGGPGVDAVQGGGGVDTLSEFAANPPPAFEGFSVDLAVGRFIRGGAETEAIGGIEDVDSDEGPDGITGGPGSNFIASRGGDDVVNPGAGSDVLDLGAGRDSSDVVDGSGDRVDCGPGVDAVRLDQFDTPVGCEGVAFVAARPAGADLSAPQCTLTRGPKKRTKRKRFFRAVSGRLTCNEAAAISARIVVRFKRVRRNRVVAARTGDLVLAQKSLPRAGGTRTLRLKPSRKIGRRLSKRFTARLVIEARDEFGNRSILTRKTRVR